MALHKIFSLIGALVFLLFTCHFAYVLPSSIGEPVDTISYPGIARTSLSDEYYAFDFDKAQNRQSSGIVLEHKGVLTTLGCVTDVQFIAQTFITKSYTS